LNYWSRYQNVDWNSVVFLSVFFLRIYCLIVFIYFIWWGNWVNGVDGWALSENGEFKLNTGKFVIWNCWKNYLNLCWIHVLLLAMHYVIKYRRVISNGTVIMKWKSMQKFDVTIIITLPKVTVDESTENLETLTGLFCKFAKTTQFRSLPVLTIYQNYVKVRKIKSRCSCPGHDVSVPRVFCLWRRFSLEKWRHVRCVDVMLTSRVYLTCFCSVFALLRDVRCGYRVYRPVYNMTTATTLSYHQKWCYWTP